ncbi:selenium metabolism-associated LysR family transcriptional regulator [Larkinella soli]|uniref:selenium metabolism-associated LysR family transcriptional regulator n=1 Tax=Larkinella soli TaxID=1770527 RepID=UPI000FFCBB23|nr:selenium metabolism-associated LysR family transcriptional regulator [Larkinella soli]
MEDFRLKVFHSVARNRSFTKASSELFITQPAVTKHIRALEDSLGLRLFDRRGNTIVLTEPGEVLYRYANQIFALYQEAQTELNAFKNQLTGSLRLGASTTIAQYLIPALLASYYERYPHIHLSLMNENTEMIEKAVLAKEIDLGIVEGQKHHAGLKYHDFLKDELVAVAHTGSRYSRLQEITLPELATVPLVLRERGSGTLEVIEEALHRRGIRLSSLQIVMHLGSSESIKSFLEHANCLGILSTRAIEKEVQSNTLKVIPIRDFSLSRTFSFVHLQGQPEGLAANFMTFANRYFQRPD